MAWRKSVLVLEIIEGNARSQRSDLRPAPGGRSAATLAYVSFRWMDSRSVTFVNAVRRLQTGNQRIPCGRQGLIGCCRQRPHGPGELATWLVRHARQVMQGQCIPPNGAGQRASPQASMALASQFGDSSFWQSRRPPMRWSLLRETQCHMDGWRR